MQPDPLALLRSRSYLRLLVLAALIGVPVSAAAYAFLKLVDWLQEQLFTELPEALGFDSPPTWWPVPLLALSGLLVALAILHLPGTGGHSPADGFKPSGPLPPAELPGVLLAALATLSFGVVLGPEAPLILMGSGLGVLAMRLAARDAPAQASTVIAAAGSFAAISSLLGSPILGAFLLLETAGLGGPMLGVVLVPGLLAAGVGTLIFVGLDELTGFGTFSLTLPGLPPFDRPTLAMFGWAIAFGLAAPFLGRGIQLLALRIRPHVERRMLLLMPVLGVLIGGLAVGFAEATGHGTANVLFSGQNELGPLLAGAAGWSVGALLLLVAVQGPGVRARAVELPRRTGVPRHVHRRGGRHGRSGAPRPRARAGGGDGDRRDVHGDARPAADRDAARDAADRIRRPRRDAAGDRRGRRGLRHDGASHAPAGRPGRTAVPRAARSRSALSPRTRCDPINPPGAARRDRRRARRSP